MLKALSPMVMNGGKLSASKLWFNIGNAALVFAFSKDAWIGGLTDMKILAFGTVICGSGVAHKYLGGKYKDDTYSSEVSEK